MKRQKDNGFTYWKRPWQKWLVLTVAIWQFSSLRTNIREYRFLSGAGIFSPSAWEIFAAWKMFHFAINGMAAVYFFGIFIIGILPEIKKTPACSKVCFHCFWHLAGA